MTQKEIKQQICNEFINNEQIKKMYGLTEGKTFEQEFSLVSFENILFDAIAGVIFFLQSLFVRHKQETTNALEKLKPHNLKWYHNKVLGFQYGFDLLPDSDKFDNSGKTDEQIQNSKIIKYCAITEVTEPSKLIIKVATEKDGKLTRITDEQKEAFDQFLSEVKDAGVKTDVISFLPDKLKLSIRIVRDKLVLDKEGKHIINGNYPVNDALKLFVKSLPFDGKLSVQKLVDALQNVEGVIDLAIDEIRTAEVSATGPDVYGNYKPVDIAITPASGYFDINLTEDNKDKTKITYL